ncbi:hypothetical protein ACFL13_01880 [Patescibacteria group bacterium]
MKKLLMIAFVVVIGLFGTKTALATHDCTFETVDSTMFLQASCTTDENILIPDGYTLNGGDYTITAIDPPGGHFTGAVVVNEGAEAYVTHLNISAGILSNVCDGGSNRLRGIMFEEASGAITHSSVAGINQGASGCQEGNAIEIRSAPFDGSVPARFFVEVAHNEIYNYQKTGIVANGAVEVNIHHNKVGTSATQENLAANSVQLGFGATGEVMFNLIDGNQWLGTSDYAATAVLLYEANGVELSLNMIGGNSEIGIYNYGNGNVIDNNKVFDLGDDAPTALYDYGIGNWGFDGVVTNNKVRGFEIPYDGVEGGKNKIIPGPQNVNPNP